MKQRFQILLLITFGLIIGFLVAEVFVRVAMPSYMTAIKLNNKKESERGKFAKYDPLLGWSGIENAKANFEWVDTKHNVTQNRFGFRGAEYNFERSEKERIVVLGDSYPWGFGVEDDELFTTVMEKKTGGAVEMVNTGTSGYGTDQEYLLWKEKAYKWKPDRVLLMITVSNDIIDVASTMRYEYNKPYFILDGDALSLKNTPVPKSDGPWQKKNAELGIKESRLLKTTLKHSVVMNVLVDAVSSRPQARAWLKKRGVISRKYLWYDWGKLAYLAYQVDLDESMTRMWQILLELIVLIDQSVEENGAKLSVVLIPPIHQVHPELWDDYLKSPVIPKGTKLSAGAPAKRIKEWCEKKNIEVIDLLAPLKNSVAGGEETYYHINRHWTPKGHDVAAGVLVDKLGLAK